MSEGWDGCEEELDIAQQRIKEIQRARNGATWLRDEYAPMLDDPDDEPELVEAVAKAVEALCDEVERLRERVKAAEGLASIARGTIDAWDGNDDVEPNFTPLRNSLILFRNTEGERE